MIQTGEFDFALNTQVDKDVRERMEQQGRKGRFHIAPGSQLEHIQLNRTDPGTEVEASVAASRCPIRFSLTCRCGRPLRWLSIGVPLLSNSTVLPANPQQLSQWPHAVSVPEYALGVQSR